MDIDIVEEIIDSVKVKLGTLLPAFSQLDYEHEILKNNERGLNNRFGFIPKAASFKEGSALSFTTMEHNFQFIITTDYMNKDDDAAQSIALNLLYSKAHGVVKALQKKSIILATNDFKLLLVNGVSMDDPENFDDNSSIVLRVNFVFTYRFKN